MNAYREPLPPFVSDDEPMPSTLRSPVSSAPPRTTMHYFEEDGVNVYLAEEMGDVRAIVRFMLVRLTPPNPWL